MTGRCVSRTVTTNAQLVELSLLSLAVQMTVVVPTKKVEPLVGMHVRKTLGAVVPGQLSVALTEKNTLLLEHRPGSALNVSFSASPPSSTCTLPSAAPNNPEPIA